MSQRMSHRRYFPKGLIYSALAGVLYICCSPVSALEIIVDDDDANTSSVGEWVKGKGPKNIESEFRERPKFEFRIDKDIKDKFLPFYGDEIKVIKKSRTLYQLDGVVFSVDSVISLQTGTEMSSAHMDYSV